MRLGSPFVLRTAIPPLTEAAGKVVRGTRRIGKRVVLALDDELFLVIHLMIAGRSAGSARAPTTAPRTSSRCSTSPTAAWCSPRRARRSARRCTWSAARTRSGSSTAAGSRSSRAILGVRGAPPPPPSHAQARAHRSHAVQRHRQRLQRRDPVPGPALSGQAHDVGDRRGGRGPVPRDPRRPSPSGPSGSGPRSGRGSRTRSRRFIGDGRPREVPPALPGLREPDQRIVSGDNESNYCAWCQTGGRLLADRALSQLLKFRCPGPSRSSRSGRRRSRKNRADRDPDPDPDRRGGGVERHVLPPAGPGRDQELERLGRDREPEAPEQDPPRGAPPLAPKNPRSANASP